MHQLLNNKPYYWYAYSSLQQLWYCITIFFVLNNVITRIQVHICFLSIMYFLNHSISIGVEFHKECYVGVCSMPWFQKVGLRTNIMQFGRYLPCTYLVGFHENSCSLHSLSLNNVFHMQWKEVLTLFFFRKFCGSKWMISCYTLHACS
jgi:hypothetical protein